MGVFDRLRNNSTEKRTVKVVGSDGKSLDMQDYSGTWASAIGTTKQGQRELSRLKPNPDEAINVSAVAARCIDLIVDTLSARNLEVTTAAGEPVDHYLERIFNESPNPSQSARLFKKAVWYRIYNHGEAVIVLDRGTSRVEEPVSAHIHYGETRVRLSKPTAQAPQGEIVAFEIKLGKDEWIPLAPTEVMWLREIDPSNPWKSRAPMEAALESIGLSRAARGWQAGQLSNGANPNGIVYVGQPETDEDYYLMRDEIEAALTGPSAAGRIATIGGPIEPKWISTSMNAQEVAYLDTLKVTDEAIANALGVPLDLIGGQRTYQNLDAAWRIFWEGTLIPKLEIIASEINRQLLMDTDFISRFETASVGALQEGQDSLTDRVSKAVESDIITIDEARQKLGFEPLPDGAGEMTITPYMSLFGGMVPAARSIVSDVVAPDTHENRSESLTEPVETVSEEVRVEDVPQYIQDNAARGVRLYEEGKAGDGVTDQTIREARQMANGFISEDKVKRMGPWIARHLGDLDAPRNNDSEDPDYPGAGLVAHLLWGSGPDKTTANRVRRWAEREAAQYRFRSGEEAFHTRGLEPEEANKILDRLESSAERVIKRMAAAQLRDAKRRLQRGERNDTFPAKASSVFNADSWAERAYEYLLPVISMALEQGYEETARALGIQLNIDNFITNAADERTKVLVDQVNATTEQILQDRLTAAATADRLSVKEYADVLDKTFDELSGYRANTIARTEMIGSFNGASRAAAVDSQVSVGREWMATNDGRTRESHSALDGYTTTSMSDPYPNGLMFPGDPSGDPAETINCRCVEIFVTPYSTEGNNNVQMD